MEIHSHHSQKKDKDNQQVKYREKKKNQTGDQQNQQELEEEGSEYEYEEVDLSKLDKSPDIKEQDINKASKIGQQLGNEIKEPNSIRINVEGTDIMDGQGSSDNNAVSGCVSKLLESLCADV
ncbi:MAG: hypothetical protein EZS28_004531 [Streblomastix strix]|uniref:Uncharacterized protein n=1 Tax=Streblomastix strix TaxID=222440 RepID=A0A5J4WXX7_9EUKA|nr:MAG: hypothetical protein EZS28_004531 [Streblomastix strix]